MAVFMQIINIISDLALSYKLIDFFTIVLTNPLS